MVECPSSPTGKHEWFSMPMGHDKCQWCKRIRGQEESKTEKKKPTLKELMTGRVLDGYIEASRVKTLEKFAEKQETEESSFDRAVSELSDVAEDVKYKYKLTDLEMRDVLELVRENYK